MIKIYEIDQNQLQLYPNFRSSSPICFFRRCIQRYWLSSMGRSISLDRDRTVGTDGKTTTLSRVRSSSSLNFMFSSMMRELLLTWCDICITACPIRSIFCFSDYSSASRRCRTSAYRTRRSPTSSRSRLFSRSYLCLYSRSCSRSWAASACARLASCSASRTREAIAVQLMRLGNTSGASLFTQTTLAGDSTKGGSVTTRDTETPSQQGQGWLQLQLQGWQYDGAMERRRLWLRLQSASRLKLSIRRELQRQSLYSPQGY